MFIRLAVFVCSLASASTGLFERPTGRCGSGTSVFHLAAARLKYLGLTVKKHPQRRIWRPKTFAKRANRNEPALSLHFDAARPAAFRAHHAPVPRRQPASSFIATMAPSLLTHYS